MKDLIYSPITQLVGETLLHSIWQGAILALGVYILFNLINSQNSAARHAIALCALVVFIILNIASFLLIMPSETYVSNIVIQEDLELPLMETIQSFSSTVFPLQHSSKLVPYFMIFWFIGLIFFAIRLTYLFWYTQMQKRNGVSAAPTFMDDTLERLIHKLNIKRRIQIFESIKVSAPCVIGHLKPILLFPIGLANGLSTDQVESIIIHELAHIKRNDYLINLLQSAVEIIYFFNPFIWIISNIIRQEREKTCDDITLAMGIPARTYVNTLASIFQHTYYQNELTLSFSKNNKLTLKRIRRIMKTESTNNNKMLLPLVMVAVMIASVYLGTKSPATGVFEIADSEMSPLVSASAFPDILFTANTSSPKVSDIVKLKIPEVVNSMQVQHQDTIDRDELKQQVKQYEEAMQRLQSSNDWKKMEQLREALVQQQKLVMKELLPEIKRAIEQAQKSVELSEEEMLALGKRMVEVQANVAEIQISEEMQHALELKAEAIEKAMVEMELKLNAIDSEELEDLADVYAEEARKMEVEALRMAEEATKIAEEATAEAEKFELFMDEFQPILIKDGYLKKGKEIDELRFKDGKVWVNDKEVKPSDAKLYYKIRNKYFESDDSFYIN